MLAGCSEQTDYNIPISDDSPDKKTILLSADGTVDCLQLRFSCAVQQKLGRQRAVGLGRAHKTHALGSTAFCLGSIGYVQTSVKRRMLPAAVKALFGGSFLELLLLQEAPKATSSPKRGQILQTAEAPKALLYTTSGKAPSEQLPELLASLLPSARPPPSRSPPQIRRHPPPHRPPFARPHRRLFSSPPSSPHGPPTGGSPPCRPPLRAASLAALLVATFPPHGHLPPVDLPSARPPPAALLRVALPPRGSRLRPCSAPPFSSRG